MWLCTGLSRQYKEYNTFNILVQYIDYNNTSLHVNKYIMCIRFVP